MRRGVSLVAMTAAVVLTGGCSESGAQCGWENRPESFPIEGEKRPVEIEPSRTHPDLTPAELDTVVPVPGGFPPLTEQVLTQLRRDTLSMAGAIGEIDAGRCEDEVDGEAGFTTRCTVTYEGVEVPWQVTITGQDPYTGWGYQYRAEPLSSVHTAQQVYAWYAYEMGKVGSGHVPRAAQDPRCDRIPDAFVAEPGQDTGYYCQVLSYSCHNGEYDFSWWDVPVRVDEDGKLRVGG